MSLNLCKCIILQQKKIFLEKGMFLQAKVVSLLSKNLAKCASRFSRLKYNKSTTTKPKLLSRLIN
jgi:hypothetical protein